MTSLCLKPLLWEPDKGFFLLDSHLERLAPDRPPTSSGLLDMEDVRRRLLSAAEDFTPHPRKVRLEVDPKGDALVEVELIEVMGVISFATASEPVEAADPFLRHKTSRRAVYDQARALHPEVEDVVLWNERGELTESCRSNLVLQMGKRRLTPPLDCGLLPGTFRAHLLAQGEIEEEVLPLESIAKADEIFLINSVRLWQRASPGSSQLTSRE